MLDHPAIPFLARLLMVYIYLTSGIAKAMSWSGNVTYMERHHLPMVPLLLAVATVIELGGSLCLILGWQARIAAFVMFVYTTILTLLLHDYWALPAEARGMQETHFRKNLAIMGGLLLLSWCGPGRWAVGHDRTPRLRSPDSIRNGGI